MLTDRTYLRTLPTLALLDAAKYTNNELALVLAERLIAAQDEIARLWDETTHWAEVARNVADA
jgi:hypothetical protein